MCTVTYIPQTKENGFILTSNRDEKAYRPTVAPTIYSLNGVKTVYPKDAKAGGSWIAMNQNGRLSCLLNGAYAPHKKEDFHTESRGNVLLNLVNTPCDVESYFHRKDLSHVEPFTIVTLDIIDGETIKFSEIIWDGMKKKYREPNPEIPHLWSSVTLYNEQQRNLRNEWFKRFLSEHKGDISPSDVLAFHSGQHTGDIETNVIMERNGGLKTVSITQITMHDSKRKMSYIDLLNDTKSEFIL